MNFFEILLLPKNIMYFLFYFEKFKHLYLLCLPFMLLFFYVNRLCCSLGSVP